MSAITGLKASDGMANVVSSIKKVMDGMGLKNNYYMMTLNRKILEEEKGRISETWKDELVKKMVGRLRRKWEYTPAI